MSEKNPFFKMASKNIKKFILSRIEELNETGEGVKEYSYDDYRGEEDNIDDIGFNLDENSSFADSCRSYVYTYDLLCTAVAEYEKAKKKEAEKKKSKPKPKTAKKKKSRQK